MYEAQEQSKNTFKPIITHVKKALRSLYDMIEMFVVAFAFIVFLYLFVASPHEVIGRSMEDNFWDGEYLLADKISYHINPPERGDVVIFKQTETADYIKRVIGLPGDTIEIRDGYFFVNGHQLVEEIYLNKNIYTDSNKFLSEGEIYTVPEDNYFVAGDNRSCSSDSRAFGPISADVIKGRAFLIYWPVTHLSWVTRQTYNTE
ncbi:MAG: signal peptidase I [Patescibacteria group bacterium]|nr:signal peptidase I [Patescibacteria group bacterium]